MPFCRWALSVDGDSFVILLTSDSVRRRSSMSFMRYDYHLKTDIDKYLFDDTYYIIAIDIK